MRKVSKNILLLNYHVRDEKNICKCIDTHMCHTFVSRLCKLGSSRQKNKQPKQTNKKTHKDTNKKTPIKTKKQTNKRNPQKHWK